MRIIDLATHVGLALAAASHSLAQDLPVGKRHVINCAAYFQIVAACKRNAPRSSPAGQTIAATYYAAAVDLIRMRLLVEPASQVSTSHNAAVATILARSKGACTDLAELVAREGASCGDLLRPRGAG